MKDILAGGGGNAPKCTITNEENPRGVKKPRVRNEDNCTEFTSQYSYLARNRGK